MDLRVALAPLALGAALLAALLLAPAAPAAPAAPGAIGPERAQRIADRDPSAAQVEAERGPLDREVVRDDGAWRVSYFDGDEEVVRVVIARGDGEVLEAWTGHQVAWQMARGREGQFGHALNAPYVWLPLCAIFLLGLLDWRRLRRIAHLDLAVLLAFGVSHIYFNRGEIGVSVPLAYVPLVYLLLRLLWIAFRGADPLRPTIPAHWLAVGAVFLIAFRVTLNIADSGVIDVGYAGVVGADRVISGEPIYGNFPDDNPFGDTYGPANYYAYAPFALAFGWSGEWDDLPAARAAAIGFDLATVAGLLMLGTRLRRGRAGRDLGIVLAFAWLAFPYTAFALQSSSNDSLVAVLVVWSLVAFANPVVRGALLAAAATTKFAPLALVPLFAAGWRGLADRQPARRGLAARPRPVIRRGLAGRSFAPARRQTAWFATGFAAVLAALLAWPAIDPGLGTLWERTIANQADRESPFSIWGQQPELAWARALTLALAAGLAAALAFVPRRRSLTQIAALTAAVLIAVQLPAQHWFYLYIPWFLAPLLATILAGVRGSQSAPAPDGRGSQSAPGPDGLTRAPAGEAG